MSSTVPQQLILFGPPGTSKSWRARKEKAGALDTAHQDIVPVAFHPDFCHGEFVARLLPLTRAGRIEYSVHAGPFIRALARAYAHLAVAEEDGEDVANVVLLIDEINRGNCAEIFGDIFQLLDRDDDGWSSYEISASELVLEALDAELETLMAPDGSIQCVALSKKVADLLNDRQLSLPPNLYLIGTMNTSDESVYFMDSAFKRRWNFEFHSVEFDSVPPEQRDAIVTLNPHRTWATFLDALNQFIMEKCTSPKLDDKLVGPWFIKAKRIEEPIPSLDANSADWHDLEQEATRVKEFNRGAEHSAAFEKKLLALINKLPHSARKQVEEYARYDANAPRKFSAIAWEKGSFFYHSRARNFKSSDARLVIEDFLEGLKKLQLKNAYHRIDSDDIVGKLFLYLWDNVFDRDKSPLCALLGVPHQSLRTFGQFVALSDRFIEQVCLSTAPIADIPTAIVEEAADDAAA